MSIFHCSIKVISRAGGRSAVASAAYRSGEKLYNEETGLTHDFTRKAGVIMSEIMLPEHAPARFADRETLWNEVQKVEKRSDAQFAREIEVAFPNELWRDDQIRCVRRYIRENFVSKGMIADWALHDKGDGNPHAHIMLTMRGFDDQGKWLPKQRSVFANARNKKGRPVYDPDLPVYDPKDKEHTSQYRIPCLDRNGSQKTRVRKGKGTEYLWEKISIPENDWNEHSNAEMWRASWARQCNQYCFDLDERIDHRSYARQGIDKEPTIHEGFTARQMEKEGKTADRCQMNREIRERNTIRDQIRKTVTEITNLITEKARSIFERFKKFRRDPRDPERSGADAGYSGRTAGRDRGTAGGERESERTAARINELKRTADESGEAIAGTDAEIAETDRRIKELRQLAFRKEQERIERFERLKSRRAYILAGGTDAREREAAGSELQRTADDITAFLRELDAEERASEEKRDDRVAERVDRENERERSHVKVSERKDEVGARAPMADPGLSEVEQRDPEAEQKIHEDEKKVTEIQIVTKKKIRSRKKRR